MMKNFKYRIYMLVSAIIIFGFAAIIFINYSSYSSVIKDDIKNISKLTSTNIYSEINNELTKPVFVSLTMANDSFLKEWLSVEESMQENSEHLKSLQNYLKGFELKYGYNSVFLVSENTKRYYHYNGIQKIVSEVNAHDQWYFNFINDNQVYSLDVDNDEAANNSLTVFVNCRIQNDDNNLMGVTGVGLNVNQIQTSLKFFEENYALEAFLIDETGLIQVHTIDKLIEKYNVFDDDSISLLKNDILNNKSYLETFPYKEGGNDGYIITKYIDDLGWYLVVKKDTSVLRKTFMSQLTNELLVLILVVFFIILIVNKVVRKYGEQLRKSSDTDYLTMLPNRRRFDEHLLSAIRDSSKLKSMVFVFDIDNFKSINDTYGHVFGDSVIKLVAECSNQIIASNGIVARWGGDEFAGIIHGSMEECKEIVIAITQKISQEPELKKYNVTISLGLSHIEKLDTVNTLMARADKAMYMSKYNGKNQVQVL